MWLFRSYHRAVIRYPPFLCAWGKPLSADRALCSLLLRNSLSQISSADRLTHTHATRHESHTERSGSVKFGRCLGGARVACARVPQSTNSTIGQMTWEFMGHGVRRQTREKLKHKGPGVTQNIVFSKPAENLKTPETQRPPDPSSSSWL